MPTPVGPENRNEPIGLFGLPEAGAGDLDGVDDADRSPWSWPKMTRFRSASRFCSRSLSSVATVRGGIAAMRATTSSIVLDADDRGVPSTSGAQAMPARARLVQHVDRLVGQMAVVHVLRGQLGRSLERLVGVGRRCGAPRSAACRPLRISMVSSTRRLADLDLLEAARQRAVALERLPCTRRSVVEPMQRSFARWRSPA